MRGSIVKTRKAKKKYRVVTIVTPDGERHRMFYNDDTNRMEV